jgi:hypothetical protein
LLATCPNPSLRDGKRAVELIQKESEQAGETAPLLLRTLAAAYAEARLFPEAVKTAKEALHGIDAKTSPAIAAELQYEIKLYESGSPYHDTP